MIDPCSLRRRRLGVSMIEMMVVIAVASTLMLVSIGWIHQSLTLASTTRHREHAHQTFIRLSRQLRDDVNAGQSIATDGPDQIVISLPADQVIVYRIDDHGVLKQHRDRASVIREDRFEISADLLVVWELSELPASISLQIQHRALPAKLDEKRKASARLDEPGAIELFVRATVDRWPTTRVEVSR